MEQNSSPLFPAAVVAGVVILTASNLFIVPNVEFEHTPPPRETQMYEDLPKQHPPRFADVWVLVVDMTKNKKT